MMHPRQIIGASLATIACSTVAMGFTPAGAIDHGRHRAPMACVAAIHDYQRVVAELKTAATKAVTTLESLLGTLTVTAASAKAKAFEATLEAKAPAAKALMARTKAAAKKCEG